MQILDHQQQRPCGGPGAAEHRSDAVEQLQPGGLILRTAGRLGEAAVEQPAQCRACGDRLFDGVGFGTQLRQRLGERQVWQADIAQIDAVTDNDECALRRGDLGRPGQQPCLADARVPGDQERARLARPGAPHRQLDLRQLLRSCNERRTRRGPSHAFHTVSRHRQCGSPRRAGADWRRRGSRRGHMGPGQVLARTGGSRWWRCARRGNVDRLRCPLYRDLCTRHLLNRDLRIRCASGPTDPLPPQPTPAAKVGPHLLLPIVDLGIDRWSPGHSHLASSSRNAADRSARRRDPHGSGKSGALASDCRAWFGGSATQRSGPAT